MDRDQDTDTVVDLGVASVETQGAKGTVIELSGFDRQMGLSDDD